MSWWDRHALPRLVTLDDLSRNLGDSGDVVERFLQTVPAKLDLTTRTFIATAEQVFRTVSGLIGDRVARIPDGETGLRSLWVIWNRDVFESNPALEIDPV